MTHIPQSLRSKVAERARHRCEYCQSQELITSGPLHVEHIIPKVAGGATTLDNLALACARCNLHKGIRTRGRDPVSGRIVPLFHPRQQRWSRHFTWSADGTRIIGLTRTGRVTVIASNMNHRNYQASSERGKPTHGVISFDVIASVAKQSPAFNM